MEPCKSCGFDLWKPIGNLEFSELGFYSDSRFPGRGILRLKEHRESLEELSDELALGFLQDTRKAMAAIRRATGATRVNFAVLGNTVAHVHGHLIPRFPENEELPGSSPWDDPRPRIKLSATEDAKLIRAIKRELALGL